MWVMTKRKRGGIAEPRRTCDTCLHSTFMCDTRHRCQAFGKIVPSSYTCQSWTPMPLMVDRPHGDRVDVDGEERRWVTELFGALAEPRLPN